jgi:UDP-N-acetylmuramyl pentapeptide phosphotransferase/UDP-N-acetylglucosamine-1-phosphate transferase
VSADETNLPGLVTLFAFLSSFALVGLVVQIARRFGVYALPGARQSHEGVVPTGGGIGMIVAISAVSGWQGTESGLPGAWVAWVVPAALVLSLIGWLDDRRPVSPLFRFIVQLAVSFGLLAFLLDHGMDWPWPVVIGGGVMLVWLMNLYNFMDGSHGMAGFQGVFVAGCFAVLSWSAGHVPLALVGGIVAGACAGFLPWNFPRPRIFMGDAGSVPLGFMLGALILVGMLESVISLPEALLLLAVFLVDASLTLFKRVIRGERWYTPHKQHVYQRLIAQGWRHSRVLLVYQAINLVVVVPALVLANEVPAYAWPVTTLVAIVMSAAWYTASSRLEMRR